VSLHQFFLALRARARLFTFILIGTIAAATAVTLMLPKIYEATASVFVESVNTPPLGYNQTQADIMTSQKVAQKVIRELKLAEDPAVRAAFEKSSDGSETLETWLTDTLQQRLKVDLTLSSVIRIIFRWSDAEFAARAANAFARSYVEASEEIRAAPTRESAAWFDVQLKQLRTTMERAQARLDDYRRGKGIVASDERIDVENARLAELSSQLLQVQNQAQDVALKDQFARGASAETLPEILANPFIQNMRADLARSEARLQEMRAEFGPNHPQHQRAVAETQILKERLQSEMQRVVGGLGTNVRHNRQREVELRRAVEGQRGRVISLKQHRDEIENLTRQAELAQRAHENGWQQALNSRIQARSRQPNVAVLNEAVVPLIPAQPKFALNIALSVIVGLMLAAGMVYFMETVDRRVRSRAEFEAYLPVPVLGQIGKWRREGGYLTDASRATRALPHPG